MASWACSGSFGSMQEGHGREDERGEGQGAEREVAEAALLLGRDLLVQRVENDAAGDQRVDEREDELGDLDREAEDAADQHGGEEDIAAAAPVELDVLAIE